MITELRAKDIFDVLRSGKQVTLTFPNTAEGTKEEQQLLNYLNVLKSRSKKALEEFGFDFTNCIFRVLHKTSEDRESVKSIFYVEKPKQVKRYAIFSIENHDNDNS